MSALELLKDNLKEENSPSEAWYNLQKAEQFEQCLKRVESHYTKAHNLLEPLIERLSAHSKPFE